MNIPMSWMRDLLGGNERFDVQTFMDKMTNAGVKVEGLTTPGEEITNVVIGKITAIEKHPNADKLWVTKATVGDTELQIVTGADNLKVNDYIPVALDGANLANGLKIKKGKLRGEASEGMLCSIEELGYTRSDYPEAPENGIYVFPETHKEGENGFILGNDARPILELCDEVVEFEIMSNRSDCNSVLGVAREVFAVYGKKFEWQETALKEEAAGNTNDHLKVEIQNPELCPRYIGRLVTDVTIGPSPQWLRRRLSLCGVRPINNIVDITNYVMLEYGQPLHAFNSAQVGQNKIIVRNAKPGEKFTTLDGVERTLDESMLLIADPDKALAIAGVMGGENSMVEEGATTILFESANFNKVNVRLTSKKLGLRTDASAKFEKGLDPELARLAVNRAMELVELLGCGKVMPGMADAYPNPVRQQENKIPYSPARINALLGTDISAEEMITLLSRIGIETHERTSTGEYEAEYPTFRLDLHSEADIAEEIARFHGYNNIPSVIIQEVYSPGVKSEKRKREDVALHTMLGLGYSQALTFPFESPKVFDKLNLSADDPVRGAISISNPLGEDFSIMRTLPFDGLLQSLARNYNHRNETARLFEQHFTYHSKAMPMTELPYEFPLLTVAAYDVGMDFFDFKGDIEQLLLSLGIKDFTFEPYTALPFMHPGRTARIQPEGMGFFGELHPQVRENYEIATRVYVAVLYMDAIHKLGAGYKPVFTPLPKFPSIQRDLALKVKVEVSAAEIEKAITERGGQYLKEVKLFDVYQGAQIEEGYKSMAYNLRFRAADRTLTDDDVKKPLRIILHHLNEKCGAELRS